MEKWSFASHAAFATFALALVPGLSQAAQKKIFARCHGDHHGSYLDLMSSSTGGVVTDVKIEVSNDGDDAAKVYTVDSVTKNGETLQAKAYSWAIRQAIKAEAAGQWYGFVKLKATGPGGSTLYVNLQRFSGTLRHALVIDGSVEELSCPVEHVAD